MKSFKWSIRYSLAISLAAMSTSWAEVAPPDDSCGQVVTASGDTVTSVSACMNELLSAQFDMIDAVEEVVMEMRSMNVFSYGSQQINLSQIVVEDDLMAKIKFLRDEHGRAMAGNDAVADSDYDEAFAKADQEKGKNCKLSDKPFLDSLGGSLPPGLKPVTGNNLEDFDAKFGDGKCNVFKARIDNPGEADDGNIVQVNERRENMCESVCEDRMNPNMGGPRKAERKKRATDRLSDGIAATLRATNTIYQAKANLTALRMQFSGRLQLSSANFSSAGTSDVCVSGTDIGPLLEIISTGVSLANSVVSFTTAILETLKDNVEPAANQTAAGFNVGASVIPFALVAGISKIAGEVVGAVEKGLSLAAQIIAANREDTLELCLKSVRDDTVLLRGEFQEGLCVNLLCIGGPDNNNPCANDSECTDGIIFKLQADSAQTAADIVLIKEELAEMKILLQTTVDFLITPTGRRDGFNIKTVP